MPEVIIHWWIGRPFFVHKHHVCWVVYGLSANEQYFSLTSNQVTVLSAMAYKPNKHKRTGRTYVKVSDCAKLTQVSQPYRKNALSTEEVNEIREFVGTLYYHCN
jgi:hypothetical protein